MTNLIPVKTFLYTQEAEIAKGLLEEKGIESIVSTNNISGYYPSTLGTIKLLVQEEDLAKAKEVLEVLDVNVEDDLWGKDATLTNVPVVPSALADKIKNENEHQSWPAWPLALIGIIIFCIIAIYFSHETKQDDIRAEKEYYPNGNIKWEATYKNGKENGIVKKYYENGNLRREYRMINGKVNGPEKGFYSSGNIKWERSYVNDQLEGEVKDYYENGQLKSVVYYHNGQLTDVAKSFYENGKYKFVRKYQNNKIIEGKDYDAEGHLIYKNKP